MSKSRTLSFLAALVAMFMAANATSYETGADAPSFVNFETPHVSPIAMTPDGTKAATAKAVLTKVTGIPSL